MPQQQSLPWRVISPWSGLHQSGSKLRVSEATPLVYVASWKMTPRVWRRPLCRTLTPWRRLTR